MTIRRNVAFDHRAAGREAELAEPNERRNRDVTADHGARRRPAT